MKKAKTTDDAFEAQMALDAASNAACLRADKRIARLQRLKKAKEARLAKTTFTPNAEQLTALQAYAAWAGADWRCMLRRDWMRGGSNWRGEWAPLQQVRNRAGTQWLARFEMEVL